MVSEDPSNPLRFADEVKQRYGARANNTGPSTAIDYLPPAMFEAALKDFPNAGPNPRQVTTQISKRS